MSTYSRGHRSVRDVHFRGATLQRARPRIVPQRRGIEQPLWDAEIGRFLLTVPGRIVNGLVATEPSVAVINPTTRMVEKAHDLDCQALAGVTSVSTTGIALGPFQQFSCPRAASR